MDAESRQRIELLEEQLKKFTELKTIVELVQAKDDNASSLNIPLPKPLNINDGDLK